jgi:uncharacterized protein DUF6600
VLRYIKTAVLATAAVLLAGVLAQPARAQVSFDLAYSNLSQNGSWLISAQYGHVWQPREYNRDWNPYYDGHWIYTDMGWTWVSDYEWGSIPYHYGTWVTDPDAGWVWVPGRVWAPSWVVFRTGSDYIGWAPVPPGFSVGMSIDMGGPSSFVFVSSRDFLAPRIRTSIVPRDRASLFINNTTVVNNIVVQNNTVVNRGPDYRTIERATGRPIHEERIESVARVAPYEHVSRAQLAVDPQSAKQGVRVAEPVPASQPLPSSEKRANSDGKPSPADASKPSHGHPATQSSAQEPTTPPAAGTPSGAADTSQKDKGKASAEQNADAQANAKVRAQQNANAQANAKAQADAKAKAQPDQSSKGQPKPKPTPDQTSKAQANAKAQADAKAKAQADAKAKKHDPDNKDQSKDTPPASKEETPQ